MFSIRDDVYGVATSVKAGSVHYKYRPFVKDRNELLFEPKIEDIRINITCCQANS